MRLKEKSFELIMSIPHLALLWDMRKHPRYKPREGLDIVIKSKDEKIYALLVDICVGDNESRIYRRPGRRIKSPFNFNGRFSHGIALRKDTENRI